MREETFVVKYDDTSKLVICYSHGRYIVPPSKDCILIYYNGSNHFKWIRPIIKGDSNVSKLASVKRSSLSIAANRLMESINNSHKVTHFFQPVKQKKESSKLVSVKVSSLSIAAMKQNVTCNTSEKHEKITLKGTSKNSLSNWVTTEPSSLSVAANDLQTICDNSTKGNDNRVYNATFSWDPATRNHIKPPQ